MIISAARRNEADDEADERERQEHTELLPCLARDELDRLSRLPAGAWNVPVNCWPSTTYQKLSHVCGLA